MNRFEMEWFNEKEREYAERERIYGKNNSTSSPVISGEEQSKHHIIRGIIQMSKLLNAKEYSENELSKMDISQLLSIHQQLSSSMYNNYQNIISENSRTK